MLHSLIAEGLKSLTYPTVADGLYEPIRYTLDSGGKRVRPTLVLMAASLYTDNLQPALQPALGIEMYHNSTLLHDDVMDNAPERRGRPTVHVRWDANQAILSGDAMIGLSYQLISQAPAAALRPVLDIFNQMYQEICQGQQYDMAFETRDDVTIPEYIEMIRLKTSVLLGRALQIGAWVGAVTAGHTEVDTTTLFRFGEQLGLAFQLQDDWLDCWGDPKTFGKRIGGDILCQKKTFLRITALDRAQQMGIAVPADITPSSPEAEEAYIAEWKAFYAATGAEEACRQAMAHYHQEAIKALQSLTDLEGHPFDAEKLQPLYALAAKLENRKQ